MSGREIFRFGDFALDPGERRLSSGTGAVRLSPKAFDLLVVLVQHPGRLLTKDELLTRVWPESFVEEGILTVHVSALRRALRDRTRPPAYIETVARSGYRFVGAVRRESKNDEPPAPGGIDRPIELYEFVGRGRSHLLSGSYFETSDAVTSFRAAIQIDSTYAPAHAGLALARCAQANLGAAAQHDAFTEARASALRALAMDSASADAQTALGTVLFLNEWDWAAAERSLRRALEMNPDHIEALLQYGSLQEALGHVDDGLRFKQRALARDRRSALVLVQIAISYWHQRNYDETRVWAQRALDVDPKHLLAGEFLAGVCWMVGDLDGWVGENVRRATVFGAPADAIAYVRRAGAEMRTVYAAGGAAALARHLADQMTRQEHVGPLEKIAVQRAVLLGAAGRLDEAFESLDIALAAHEPALVHLAVAPQWDSLREDPRFGHRLRTMALPDCRLM
jgi:DNA-binding winged helix-turn-helix (wHTH) protein/Tfp pilus assembly protein PilF